MTEERQYSVLHVEGRKPIPYIPLVIDTFSGEKSIEWNFPRTLPFAYDRKIRLWYWKQVLFPKLYQGKNKLYPSPFLPPQFEMTAGRTKCVPISLSSWGSCQTAWKGSLKAARDDWALKGCGEWSKVICITKGKHPHAEPSASWREKQHPGLGGKKGARKSERWVRPH